MNDIRQTGSLKNNKHNIDNPFTIYINKPKTNPESILLERPHCKSPIKSAYKNTKNHHSHSQCQSSIKSPKKRLLKSPNKSQHKYKHNNHNNDITKNMIITNYELEDLQNENIPNKEYYDEFLLSLQADKRQQRLLTPKPMLKRQIINTTSSIPNAISSTSFRTVEKEFNNIKKIALSCFKNQSNTPVNQSKQLIENIIDKENIQVISPKNLKDSVPSNELILHYCDIKDHDLNLDKSKDPNIFFKKKQNSHANQFLKSKNNSNVITKKNSQKGLILQDKENIIKVMPFQSNQTECKNDEIPKSATIIKPEQKTIKRLFLCCIPIT